MRVSNLFRFGRKLDGDAVPRHPSPKADTPAIRHCHSANPVIFLILKHVKISLNETNSSLFWNYCAVLGFLFVQWYEDY